MATRVLLLTAIILGSCKQPIQNEDIRSLTIDTNRYLLPIKAFKDTSSYVGSDTALVEAYTSILKAMREPTLFNQPIANETYRFLWLRTFHQPVVIRIEQMQNRYYLYWKVASGKGGNEPCELVIYKSREISRNDWDQFQNLLAKIDFWNASTILIKEQLGFDGSQWIFEGVRDHRYHITDRWSPRNNDYYKCGAFLIGLTDLQIPDWQM
ncbi:MAG: hypothetical protein HOP30_16565 [Cyclobacteriaceae bacterium]|nr:hypothetical protein [Cyclobacteriaceae bacterium]